MGRPPATQEGRSSLSHALSPLMRSVTAATPSSGDCMVQRLRSWCGTALILILMVACATMGDPIKVQVVGLEPLPGQGMELRFAAKLRVQNPNEAPIDYDGIAVDLELRGNAFASGVSDARGTIPRYGESVLTVPVTVSAFAMVRQAMGFASGDSSKIDYVLRGKVGGSTFGSVRFESRGVLELPGPASTPPQ
jgi:LEA14-like dessication related protein